MEEDNCPVHRSWTTPGELYGSDILWSLEFICIVPFMKLTLLALLGVNTILCWIISHAPLLSYATRLEVEIVNILCLPNSCYFNGQRKPRKYKDSSQTAVQVVIKKPADGSEPVRGMEEIILHLFCTSEVSTFVSGLQGKTSCMESIW
jgi:hypothetical protein